MTTHSNIKRKCDSCGEWNTGKPKFCQHCGGYLDLRQKENEEKEAAKQAAVAAEKAAFEAKSPTMKFLIRLGRVAQAVYMAIVSFIAWVLFWLGG